MNTASTTKPYLTESKPLAMFSLPSDGPTVRSSMISIGAARAPARISSAMSCAPRDDMRPRICSRPPPISSRMTGAVMTSDLPFSISRMAIRLPTLSSGTSLKIRAPVGSRSTWTAGSPLCGSNPDWASLMRSPVSTTCFCTRIGWPLRSVSRSLPKGTEPPTAASSAPGSSLTIRISSVAVRPRMSLARAVSWTPGSCTTTRSVPACWMIGSATPSSLTRLRRIVMFCWTALSWMRVCAGGESPATSRRSPPAASCSRTWRSGRAFATDSRVDDLLLPHQRADVGCVAVGCLVERRLHVDLQQEMHAAPQVEAEIHRQRANRREPVRRRRQQVERDDVVVAELGLQQVLGAELGVVVVEAHLDAHGVELGAAVRDVRRLQRVFDRAEQRVVDLECRLRRRDLDCRYLGEEVGQRVEHAHDQRDGDYDVLPERIPIHGQEGAGSGGAGGLRESPIALEPLERALGQQLRDCRALHDDLRIGGDLDSRVLLVELDDAAKDAARRGDFVALLEGVEHRARFLLLFLLRPDQQEIEDNEDRDHREEGQQGVFLACGSCRLCISGGDKHVGVSGGSDGDSCGRARLRWGALRARPAPGRGSQFNLSV